jgi:hypothetical protein
MIVASVLAAFGSTNMTAAGQTRDGLNSSSSNDSGPARIIDGVPLIHPTKAERDECQKVANATHAGVPCPELIPDPIPTSESSSNCAGEFVGPTCGRPQIAPIERLTSPYFFWQQTTFQVPAGYVGVPEETTIGGEALGHFVIYAGKTLDLSRFGKASPIPDYCTQVRRLRVHRVTARMYQCANSDNGRSVELDVGHELLIWKQNGVICEVSLHGHSQVNQDLDLVIANATKFVFPAKM